MTPAERDAKAGAIVDELGPLEKELKPHKAKIDRVEELRRSLRRLYDDADADKAHVASGKRWEYVLGEKALERHIPSMVKVFKALKQRAFLSLCSFPLKHMDANDLGHLTEKRRTGPRSLKALEKGSSE